MKPMGDVPKDTRTAPLPGDVVFHRGRGQKSGHFYTQEKQLLMKYCFQAIAEFKEKRKKFKTGKHYGPLVALLCKDWKKARGINFNYWTVEDVKAQKKVYKVINSLQAAEWIKSAWHNTEKLKKSKKKTTTKKTFASASQPVAKGSTDVAAAAQPLSDLSSDSPLVVAIHNKDHVTFGYCWTHGLTTDHNSRSCSHKANDHQEDATIDNMMGGNNTICRRPGERNIFLEKNPNDKTPPAIKSAVAPAPPVDGTGGDAALADESASGAVDFAVAPAPPVDGTGGDAALADESVSAKANRKRKVKVSKSSEIRLEWV